MRQLVAADHRGGWQERLLFVGIHVTYIYDAAGQRGWPLLHILGTVLRYAPMQSRTKVTLEGLGLHGMAA